MSFERVVTRGRWAALVAASTVLLLWSCKKKGGDEIQYPQGTPTATTPGMTATAPATTPSMAPTAPPPTAAQPLDAGNAAALGAAIDARAATEAKGMTPEGTLIGGIVPAGGQVDSGLIYLDMNKCYGVIAQGGMGVTDIDVRIEARWELAGLPVPPQLSGFALAVDATTTPSTSGSIMCYTNTWITAVPAAIVVQAKGGSGPVAAKVYKK